MDIYEQTEKLADDIKNFKVQGNTNIAKTVAKGLLDFVTHAKPHSVSKLIGEIKIYGEKLANARPNEPLAINAVSYIIKDIDDCETQQEIRVRVINRIEEFFRYIDESYEIIRINGFNLLRGFNCIFTHCHSSLARDVLIKIGEANPQFIVINDETRPLYQGRITAEKISKTGVHVIHTVDSAAASFFLDKRYPKPDAVLVGSDGITVKGDLVNKVGTYNIALAAKEAGIPFFAITQTMKIDLRSQNGELDIEKREPVEVWKTKLANVEIINPAFDLVPAKFITGGFITEKGLLKPEDFILIHGSRS